MYKYRLSICVLSTNSVKTIAMDLIDLTCTAVIVPAGIKIYRCYRDRIRLLKTPAPVTLSRLHSKCMFLCVQNLEADVSVLECEPGWLDIFAKQNFTVPFSPRSERRKIT